MYKIKMLIMMIFIIGSVMGKNTDENNVYQSGLYIKTGSMNSIMIDKYISNENYSGSYPFGSIGWRHSWSGGFMDMAISLGNTDDLSNGNISSWYDHGSFNLNLLYKLEIKKLNMDTYIGPYIDFSNYYFSHTFSTQTRYESEGSLVSFGINSSIFYPLYNKIRIELSLFTSIISVVEKTFDYQRYPDFEGNSKLTTFLSSGSYGAEIGLGTYLLKNITFSAHYIIMKTRINEWDNYIDSRNIFSIELGYDL
ncbi:hypothetical protein ACFL5D_02135 [Candidatus Neomarinimicrobiota bacterium]